MTRITYTSIYIAILAAGLLIAAFKIGNQSLSEALILSMLFSLPFITSTALFYNFGKKKLGFGNSIFFSAVLGSFVMVSILHVGYNGLMLIGVLQQSGFGPAQGYWFLIIVAGTIKSIIIGAGLGALSHMLYAFWNKYVS